MTDETYQDKLNDLNLRRALCKECIRILDEMPKETEGRTSALVEYKRQLASIDGKITNLTGTPPPIVIGLKTAKLLGTAGLEGAK